MLFRFLTSKLTAILTLAQLCRREMFAKLCLNSQLCPNLLFFRQPWDFASIVSQLCPIWAQRNSISLCPSCAREVSISCPTVALCPDCVQLDYRVTKTFDRSITVQYFEENRIPNSVSAGYELWPKGSRSIILEYVALWLLNGNAILACIIARYSTIKFS